MTPVLLDISRTISRAPHPVPTGIDRVERAYIDEYLNADRQVWFLSRIAGGFAILDKAAMALINEAISGHRSWASKDLIARLFGRNKPEMTKRAESDIRRLALATCGKNGLAKMLVKHLPAGFSYLNVGHSNRKAATWKALRNADVGRIAVMIHDVIPLDFPQYSRPDTQGRFEQELRLSAQNCDCLIYNSAHTAARCQYWLQKWQIPCDSITALLGIAEAAKEIPRVPADRPYFIILGTIEPRKNHQLLLNIWQEFCQEHKNPPHLHIVGRRGWLNAEVFQQLDQADFMKNTVFEHNDLDDAGLIKLLSGARALLFPSFAEGFGYPLLEALQQKIPAICSNLPCFQEISGDIPIYLDPRDKKGWKNEILAHSGDTVKHVASNHLDFPSWKKHFNGINTIL